MSPVSYGGPKDHISRMVPRLKTGGRIPETVVSRITDPYVFLAVSYLYYICFVSYGRRIEVVSDLSAPDCFGHPAGLLLHWSLLGTLCYLLLETDIDG